MKTVEEIIRFLEPLSVHTYIYDEEYITGFTYYSRKHPMYEYAKKRKVTIRDLIWNEGHKIPHKIEFINDMLEIYFD